MVFHTKPALRLLRYFILIIFIGFPLALATLAFDRTIVQQSDMIIHVGVCIGLAMLGGILIHMFFWEKCFATLTVFDEGICWKCPFRKTHTLSLDECNHIGVQLEESHSGLSYPFIYLSNAPYPTEHVGKINKVPCKNGFIKFWYSEELCDYLISHLPKDKTGLLSAYRYRSQKL